MSSETDEGHDTRERVSCKAVMRSRNVSGNAGNVSALLRSEMSAPVRNALTGRRCRADGSRRRRWTLCDGLGRGTPRRVSGDQLSQLVVKLGQADVVAVALSL